MMPRNRKISGVDGLSLNLVDWGGEGSPLLLLHGFGHGARLWDAFVPDLLSRYHVLALDNRGHGLSDIDPEFRYHNAAIARDVEAVADQLGLEDAVVIGHSQGGHAAIRLAGRHPGRVKKLVLAEVGPDGSTRSGTPETVRLLQPAYTSEGEYASILVSLYPEFPRDAARSIARNFLKARDGGGFSPRLDRRFLSGRAKKKAERSTGFDRVAWAKKEEGRFWHYISRIGSPTLVLRGGNSPMLPDDSLRRIRDELRGNASVQTISDAGHSLMLDKPSGFHEALVNYLLD